MKEINKIGAFTKMCCTIGNLPTSYMASMSYEETLLWLCNYLEKTIIPAVNGNAEAVEELQQQFTILQNYVDHYFDNLDIQTEINNKLDEMAESGELTDIIAQYLQLAGILAFNTASDLANAENLANGSFTKIYGKTSYNDGYGAFYKIRTLINTDVIDDDNLIALTNYPTLVAEKIPDAIVNELVTNTSNLQAISNFNENNYTLCIGDSYARGSSAGSFIDGWPVRLQTLMNLSNDYFKKIYESGTGFCEEGLSGHTFLTLLQDNIDNIPNKDKIKNIIICAGHNDYSHSQSDIETAMITFINYCHANIPNATIYCGMIGGNLEISSTGVNRRYGIFNNVLPAYANFSNLGYKCVYLPNLENILKNPSYMSSDGFHPNQTGYNKIASAIYNAVIGNFSYISGNLTNTFNVALSLASGSSAQNFETVTNIYNNVSTVQHGLFNYTLANSLNLDAYNQVKFIENVPVYKTSTLVNTIAFIKANGTWKTVNAVFVPNTSENAIYLRFLPEDDNVITGLTNIILLNQSFTLSTLENYFIKV